MRRSWILWMILGTIFATCSVAAGQATVPAKHPFSAKDFALLHSAQATAVSPEGVILYTVTFGGERGPSHDEWWTIGADGAHARKLDLPEGFSPMGFSRDGQSLYGGWKVNNLLQLAVFRLQDGKAAPVPSTVVLLPRGIESAVPTPQGTQFAIVADPRPPDPLDEVRHVQESDESSLYVVNADGTGGGWWCSDLKHVSSGAESDAAGALAWSADGKSLAVLSEVPRIGHHEVGTEIDLCSASGDHRVAHIGNSVAGIAWTNGGRDLAFLSTKSAVLTPEHVWTVPVAGGDAEDRTPTLDGTAMDLAGDARGHVWVVMERGVRNEVDEYRRLADAGLQLVGRSDGRVAREFELRRHKRSGCADGW